MTLVVAQMAGATRHLVGDSALTAPEYWQGLQREIPTAEFAQTLKLIVLHRGLCIAYAGGAEDGRRAILNLEVDPHTGFDLNQVTSRLLEAHRALVDTDFLIASLIPTPALIKVAHGRAHDATRGFVGNAEAHVAYQRELVEVTPAVSERERMYRAIERVIEDEDTPTVGGRPVAVSAGPRGFEYTPLPGVMASSSLTIPGGTPAGTYLLPVQRTAAEGGYRHGPVVPLESGVGALGLFFQPGDLGLLMYPAASLYPIPFSNVRKAELERQLYAEYGLRMRVLGDLSPDW